MNAATASFAIPTFRLWFGSLFDPGHGYAFPCNRRGDVDIDRLTPRSRGNYLYARAMVGREFERPAVVTGD